VAGTGARDLHNLGFNKPRRSGRRARPATAPPKRQSGNPGGRSAKSLPALLAAALNETVILGHYFRSWPALCRLSTPPNARNGTLYVGVTDDLARRAWEHRAGLVEGFTKQYGLARLVFAEHHDDMRAARQRERNMKHWRRAWKVRLILDQNPDWADLYDRLS
jgi:putative endonuclease